MPRQNQNCLDWIAAGIFTAMKKLLLYWVHLNLQYRGALFLFLTIWSVMFLFLVIDEIDGYATQPFYLMKHLHAFHGQLA